MRWFASHSGRRPVVGPHPVLDVGDDSPVRRGTTRGHRRMPTTARDAHARYFAGREADVLALWDSPRQREAYDWFDVELANLRAAFRWAADHDDLDTAATIATYAAFVGTLVEQYEPLAWAEEIIEPARALQHRRLRSALRDGDADLPASGESMTPFAYSERAQTAYRQCADSTSFPFDYEAYHGSPYIAVGQPERWADACRVQLEHDDDSHGYTRACLGHGAGSRWRRDEATAASRWPRRHRRSHRKSAFAFDGTSRRRLSPPIHRSDHRTGGPPAVAEDRSGKRQPVQRIAHRRHFVASWRCITALPQSAFDHLTSGDPQLPRLGQHRDAAQPAGHPRRLVATGSATSNPPPPSPGSPTDPLTRMAFPEITTTIAHLREVLGDDAYESFRSQQASP